MNTRDFAEVDKRVRESSSVPFSCNGSAVHVLPFTSAHAGHLLGGRAHRCELHGIDFPPEEVAADINDCGIEENINFRYPLVLEPGVGESRRHDRVLILLHGLNERSYSKYLLWATRLRAATETPVLLFPMAFHMNRGLQEWVSLSTEVHQRRREMADNDCAHRFNAIISDRLESHPERFFWGVIQSYSDLLDLVRDIRSGNHPHFAKNARVDFLGYSAGGYLSLLALLEDPEQLFSDTRAVIFGSCVAVRDLNLASPVILDGVAEAALVRLYVRQMDRLTNERMRHWLECHGEGKWFRALSGLRANSELLEQRLRQIAPRVLGIANTNDHVTPAGPMLNVLQGLRRDTGVRFEEFSLGLHESPFVCDDYGKSCRRLVTEVLDEERYGAAFERFIEVCAGHLR